MYTRILVPLDGSDFAAQALPYARRIGQALNAEMELFRVMPSLIDFLKQARPTASAESEDNAPVIPAASIAAPWEERYEQAKRRIHDEMEALAAPMRELGLSVGVELGEGDPAEAIAREADRMPSTLIVMTTHGRSGLLRMWAGSVTDKALHMTATPALVVRSREGMQAPQDPQFRRIILPLDGSPLSEEALPHAMALAKALRASVEVVQAFSKSGVAVDSAGAEAVGANGAGVTGYLEATVERIRLGGLPRVEATPVQGDAANTVIETAEHTSDSLVVMSTHGRSGLGRLLRGSVADKVVRRANRPVLLIRPLQQ